MPRAFRVEVEASVIADYDLYEHEDPEERLRAVMLHHRFDAGERVKMRVVDGRYVEEVVYVVTATDAGP